MKKDEVPQDQDKEIYQDKFGPGLIKYAIDDNKDYTTVHSSGWEPEIVALRQAWEEVDRKTAEALMAVKEGRLSPIAYFIEKKVIDLPILAAYIGKWKWQVKRHLKPSVFKKLSDRQLRKYADVFGVSVETLRDFKIE